MKYKFFQHKKCEYFPCHKGIPKGEFSCLFCFCPLYTNDNCGGNHTKTKKGKKDCTKCLIPHRKEGYDYIVSKLKEL